VAALDETASGAGGFGSTGVESDAIDETAATAGLDSLSGIKLRRPAE
jgi:dUTP pyrophosphatase